MELRIIKSLFTFDFMLDLRSSKNAEWYGHAAVDWEVPVPCLYPVMLNSLIFFVESLRVWHFVTVLGSCSLLGTIVEDWKGETGEWDEQHWTLHNVNVIAT